MLVQWRLRDGRGEEDLREGFACDGGREESTASPCLTALLFRLSAHKWDQESRKTGSISQAWLKLSKVFKLVPAAQKQFLSLCLQIRQRLFLYRSVQAEPLQSLGRKLNDCRKLNTKLGQILSFSLDFFDCNHLSRCMVFLFEKSVQLTCSYSYFFFCSIPPRFKNSAKFKNSDSVPDLPINRLSNP